MINIFRGTSANNGIIFMDISKDVFDEDVDVSHVQEIPQIDDPTPPYEPPEFELLISLNALSGFFAPQTLKLIGYIKNRKFIILFDSGSTHNFFHRYIPQEVNCYICVINNFQDMIANGGSMKCGGHFENLFLQIGQYHLKTHMFSIDMGGCDIISRCRMVTHSLPHYHGF
jgi:hypothetical protein